MRECICIFEPHFVWELHRGFNDCLIFSFFSASKDKAEDVNLNGALEIQTNINHTGKRELSKTRLS